MNLPFDINVQPKPQMGKTAKEHLEELIDRLKIVKSIVKESKDQSQVKAKAPEFEAGDMVMLKAMKVPKGLSPKLHVKWDGPFYIVDVRDNHT